MKRTKADALQTREQLLHAALEVFYRQGVSHTPLQAIAQEAGVTRGALYWHFKNKEDLFDALFQHYAYDFLADLQSDGYMQADNVLEYLRHILLNVCRRIADNEQQRKFSTIIHHKCERTDANQTISAVLDHYYDIFSSQLIQILQHSRSQGTLPEHISPEFAMLHLKSSFVGLLNMWLHQPDRFPLVETADRVLQLGITALQQTPQR